MGEIGNKSAKVFPRQFFFAFELGNHRPPNNED